jgi:ABC-type dipeptide/oligopeptide/nickel transport system permease component
MIKFILQRLLALIVVVFGIITLTFFMRVIIPGDPIDTLLFGSPKTEEAVRNMRAEWGLDKPLLVQYFNYLGGVVHGDLGKSLTTRRYVIDEIGDRYVKTVTLAVAGQLIGLIFGLLFGTIAARYKNTAVDTSITALSLIGLSLSPIWLGLVLINLLGVQLQILPVVGKGDIVQLIMPALTLGIIQSAIISRFVRSSLLEVLGQDYIRTASSKGLGFNEIMTRHAYRNAMIPVVTIVGLQFGSLLGGAVIIENIFAWPGLGQLAVKAIGYRDYPVIQGIVLVAAVTYVLINLVVDLLYFWIDPRLQAQMNRKAA